MGFAAIAQGAIEGVLGVAGGDDFPGEAPVLVCEVGGFFWKNEDLDAIKGGAAYGGLGEAF